ncbi:MAG: phosphatase [Pleurocapsa sp. SU_5_0]|nr:phosphatase [Pleurocapsa sp. SU_5_0]NJO98106.1 phosphatase [Pleurocapsa sp. CRU_1_2]NJR44416.1 phosphatase [Hyellaceae cyanobacterium CSU_1_1]
METIRDYYQINNYLATSGQPTPREFASIAQAGYQVVINLATSRSTNALANEGIIVTDLGIVYVQIPVLWDNPRLEDVETFFKIMHSFDGQKVWVHCAKNMRVSCFIYFWQKYILHLPESQASYPMNQIWQPTGVWQTLVEQAETSLVSGNY